MNNPLRSTTLRFGLVGWPLSHSLSPFIHTSALEAAGLAGEYQLFPVYPLPMGMDDLKLILSRMRGGELHGLNVTIPYKQSVMPMLDRLTGVAESIGAVNLIYMEQDRLTGDNSDAPAFLLDMQRKLGFFERTRTALILGAGGAARAAVYALLQNGWNIYVASRRVDAARQILTDLIQYRRVGSQRAAALPLEPAAIGNLAACDLVVNATPSGMYPDIHGSPWPDGIAFPPKAAFYDMVYNPPVTSMIQAVRAAGMVGTNGLGMLVEQAALSFERWTSRPAPRQVMWEAAMKSISVGIRSNLWNSD